MNAIEKLLRKIARKDKKRLLGAIELIHCGKLHGIKLKDRNEYRVRIGNYRILYHIENTRVIIDSVRRRTEGTYK